MSRVRRGRAAGALARRANAGRLPRPFFARPTVRVARDLLGATFTVKGPAGRRSVRIVETEAYVADDPANHADRGMTRRNRSMFGAPGTVYVYRIHQVVCANVVTRPGQAVLLRAAEPLGALSGSPVGPGRLCRVLGITQEDDGKDAVVGPRFTFAQGPPRSEKVVVGPRVGISQAMERPLRFALAGSNYVSRPRLPSAVGSTSASPKRSRGAVPYPRSRTKRKRPSGGGRSGARSVGR